MRFKGYVVRSSILLPLLALVSCSTGDNRFAQFREDLVILKQVCETYGAGDKVYRTVENVRGILRMNVTAPNQNLGDQFGLAEPWMAHFFPDGPDLMPRLDGRMQIMYWFSEAPPASGSPPGSPYRRYTLTPGDIKPASLNIIAGDRYVDAEGYIPGSKWLTVRALASEYAFNVEDLTTREMREHWITGARLKIIKRETQELLAERVHFYRAFGPRVLLSWSGAVGCENSSSGYDIKKYVARNPLDFIQTVLKPPSERPVRPILFKLMEENYGWRGSAGPTTYLIRFSTFATSSPSLVNK